ncbi:MAG: aminotransferase class I/II-fold pyridoxal phosphate-dependent enzyme [Desulfobacterales bacterium]|nr:aminotransferase class I/II-fold pyridoxal phosphate-dependent enzyme [Desulfobacterales bacterium]
MSDLNVMPREELTVLRQQLRERFERFKQAGLSLDLTRGKPCPEQLDLSNPMLAVVSEDGFRAADGTDCRNYGGLDGIPEAKALFAEYMGVTPAEVIIGGNASLTLMYDTFIRAMFMGTGEGQPPWAKMAKVRCICPSPGYDRHFSICANLGIEMIPVEMNATGPDMDAVESLVAEDETIKGIWCVPIYSNPTGDIYSDETVDRLARMPTRAQDFRIFWDNAYAVHHFAGDPPAQKHILTACKEAGHPERPLMFGSTSKITFPGGGLGLLAGSARNMDWVRQQLFYQTIGPDKLNQLRHVRFFGNLEGIHRHMQKHAAIVRPRFEAVETILTRELAGRGIAEWTRPQGGYFVSFNAPDGCAQAVVAMAQEAGVKLTPAGATYPLGIDPRDRNIRIAPTFAALEDVNAAVEVLAVCTQIVSIEKILG